MEGAPLPARIYRVGQVFEKRFVVGPPQERRVNLSRVDRRDSGPVAPLQKALSQPLRVSSPQWKQGPCTQRAEELLAVCAHVVEEEISRDDGRVPRFQEGAQHRLQPRLVHLVWRLRGHSHHVQRKAKRVGLLFDEDARGAVHRNPIFLFRHRREQGLDSAGRLAVDDIVGEHGIFAPAPQEHEAVLRAWRRHRIEGGDQLHEGGLPVGPIFVFDEGTAEGLHGADRARGLAKYLFRHASHEHALQPRPAMGAGIYLRHVWGNTVPSFYENPRPNHTAYAYTWVYSPVQQTAGLYARFQNYSRSEKDLPPPRGKWDYQESRIWLNDQEIQPPKWENTHTEKSSEIPLGNENWEGTTPIPVTLKKGWNKLVLKMPVGEFSTEEVRLVKWMFNAVLVTTDGEKALSNIKYSPQKSLQ